MLVSLTLNIQEGNKITLFGSNAVPRSMMLQYVKQKVDKRYDPDGYNVDRTI